jgi:ligand-binding sensor protein
MKWTLGELVNLGALQTMAENLYAVSGIPVGILDADGKILIATGWQDICTKFHRMNALTAKRCELSDQYIKEHLHCSDLIMYKCMNHMWEVAVPVIIEGEYIAFVMLGQFFYEDEPADIDVFINQGLEFGFNEQEYIAALKKVPVFSRQKVKDIMEYYKALVVTLVESSMTKIQYVRADRKYRNLFDSMKDLVFILDDDGRFVECNKPMHEKLYLTIEEFIGQRYSEVLPAEVSNLLKDAIHRLENENIIAPFDYSLHQFTSFQAALSSPRKVFTAFLTVA